MNIFTPRTLCGAFLLNKFSRTLRGAFLLAAFRFKLIRFSASFASICGVFSLLYAKALPAHRAGMLKKLQLTTNYKKHSRYLIKKSWNCYERAGFPARQRNQNKKNN